MDKGMGKAVQRKKFLSSLSTAIGNFSVQYNFQAISIALIVMSASVCTLDDSECKEGEQASWVKSTASAVVFAGAVCGQLTMGYASDVVGRNSALILTLAMVGVSALVSAMPSGSASTIYTVIIVARFFLGFGAGGVYPLSATKAAEDAAHGSGSDEVDVIAASKAFFWQVPGTMGPWLIALFMAYSEGVSADTQWRLLLALGSVPAFTVVILTFIELRLENQVEEYESLTLSIPVESGNASTPLLDEMDDNSPTPVTWELLEDLLATGGGWFIYDIAYYGVNLFGGEIVSSISSSDDDNVSSRSAIQNVTGQELIGLSMGIPACILTIYALHHITPKYLQIYGFLFIALCFSLLALLYITAPGESSALFFVYCLLLFSLSFGPNVTTYVLPAKTFPKKVRGTYNGISAACGKLGAIAGVYMFGPVSQATSFQAVMGLCAIFSVIGAILSYRRLKD